MSSAHVESVDRPQKPPQFTLRQLIGWTVWVAVGLALITQGGAVGLAIFWFGSIIGAILYGVTVGKSGWWGTGVAGLLFTFWFCALFLPAVSTPRGPARRSQCSNNLKQIMLGLQNYHDTYNSLPPAYIADANGKPMHSWRVLILPFCEQKNLYDAYDFNEPWEGPNNRKLWTRTPDYLFCPSESGSPQSMETSYLAVTGPGTAFPGPNPLGMAAITDGTSSTVVVVEVHDSGIHWMEPRDFDIQTRPLTVNAKNGKGICSHHTNGAQVGFMDGYVQLLTNQTPPGILRALFTIDGGEKLPPEF